MNKCIRAIVLVLALAMLLTGALAEATVTPMETLAGAEWIDGTSLLAIEGENGLSAMANIDGTPLTDSSAYDPAAEVTAAGFTVRSNVSSHRMNIADVMYHYLAFRV